MNNSAKWPEIPKAIRHGRGMEDLLEELLNVLAEPSNRKVARSATSPAKQLVADGEATPTQIICQKTQANGRSVSSMPNQAEKAVKIAGKYFEIMTIASFANAATSQRQRAALSVLGPTEMSRALLMFDAGIAAPDSSSHHAFYIQIKDNKPVQAPVEEQDELVEEQNEPVEKEIENSGEFDQSRQLDQTLEAIAHNESNTKEEAVLAQVENLDSSTEKTAIAHSDQTMRESASSAIGSTQGLTQQSAPEASEFSAFELDPAEIDESVMSAFDIGDFEADTYAAQTDSLYTERNLADSLAVNGKASVEFSEFSSETSDSLSDEMSDEMLEDWAEHSESINFALDERDLAGDDFDRLDAELETTDLETAESETIEPETTDLETADLETAESESAITLVESEFYEATDSDLDSHLEIDESSLAKIAEIAPNEIAASEQKTNFIARWLRRWLPTESDSSTSDELNQPILFASTDNQHEQANLANKTSQKEASQSEADQSASDQSEADQSEADLDLQAIADLSPELDASQVNGSVSAAELSQISELQLELESFLEEAGRRTSKESKTTDASQNGAEIDRDSSVDSAQFIDPDQFIDSDQSTDSDQFIDLDRIELNQTEPSQLIEQSLTEQSLAEQSLTEQSSNEVADKELANQDSHLTAMPADDEWMTRPDTEALSYSDADFEPDLVHFEDIEEDPLLEPLGEKDWLSAEENANEALHISAANGDLSGVWAALEANASANQLGPSWRTALSVAVEAGHLPVVKLLLEMCANPNQADLANGSPVRYPLMVAATSKTAEPVRDELLQLLLASGAEVNQTNMMGQTALMGAAEQGHIGAMRRLLEANANADLQDLLGQTAIARAREHNRTDAIALIQQSAVEKEQAIALLKAITRGDLEEVRQWLAAGLSANTQVARMSALAQAAAKGEVEIARLLIEAGADVNYQFYKTDPTPLFHAAYRGQLEIVSLLLESGASTHLTPNASIGALDYAEIGQRKSGNIEAFRPVIELLATLATRPST